MTLCSRMMLCLALVSYGSMGAATASQANKGKKAPDLTGGWTLVVTFERGGGTDGALRLTQEGTKVTGSFTRTSVDATVTGTVKGKSVTLSIVHQKDDETHTLTLTGTVEDERTLKGRAISRAKGPGTDAGAEGTFVAKRKS